MPSARAAQNEDAKRIPWFPLVTAVLSVFSALGVAYLAYLGAFAESKVKGEEVGVQRAQITLQQSQFNAEVKRRDEERLMALIPLILHSDHGKVREGTVTLRLLMPERAPDILRVVETALTAAERQRLQPTVQASTRAAAALGDWVIVIGGDRALEPAQHEASRAVKEGHTPTIYQREGWYRTAIGPFPTRNDAESANIAARATLNQTAYVVSLPSWCPNSTRQDGYVTCAAR